MNEPFDKETIELIDAYLSKQLSATEKQLFEQRISSEPELNKEVQLRATIYAMLGEKDWASPAMERSEIKENLELLRSEELQKASSTIKQAATSYKSKSNSSNKRPWIIGVAVAASLALLFLMNPSDPLGDVYEQYHNWGDLPSAVEKGAKDELSQAEIFFEDKEYDQIIKLFDSVYKSVDRYHPTALLYAAAAHQELKQYEQAHTYYDALINAQVLESSRALWFKFLLYLKQDDNLNSKETLDKILSDPTNYNYQKAKTIANILE